MNPDDDYKDRQMSRPFVFKINTPHMCKKEEKNCLIKNNKLVSRTRNINMYNAESVIGTLILSSVLTITFKTVGKVFDVAIRGSWTGTLLWYQRLRKTVKFLAVWFKDVGH